MAVSFPQNPTEGSQFISPEGTIFVFTDNKWVSAAVNPNYADIQGATGPEGPAGEAGSTGENGTPGTPGDPGAAGATGANAIGQVQSTTKTNSYYAQNISSWTDLPNISVTITPTSASSKIWVLINLRMSTGANEVVHLRLLRNGTLVGNGAGSGNRPSAFASFSNVDNASQQYHDLAHNYLDSPNTTSAVTYKVQAINAGFGVDQIALNRVSSDSNSAQVARTSSTITVVEVM